HPRPVAYHDQNGPGQQAQQALTAGFPRTESARRGGARCARGRPRDGAFAPRQGARGGPAVGGHPDRRGVFAHPLGQAPRVRPKP
nr:hypothetical protein [Tanacetum cinerariifolium]